MQIRAPGSSWDLPAEPRTVSSSPAAPGRPPLAPGRGASGPDALQPPARAAGRAAAPRRARARSPSPCRTPSLPGPQPVSTRAPLGRPVASPALNSSHRGAPRPPPPPIRNFHGELVSPRREPGTPRRTERGRGCATGGSPGGGVGPGRGVGRLGPRERGARVAPWPPWRRVPRCGHPEDFSPWVIGPWGGGGGVRRRGRAAPQVSVPQGHAEVWWEGRGRAHRRALWRVPAGRAGCSPAPAAPGAQRGSPSPRARPGSWPGPWRGLLRLHNLGSPQGPGSPEARGGARLGALSQARRQLLGSARRSVTSRGCGGGCWAPSR